MFDKLLIANRGAIATRIERTCRRLGVPTLAVYAEADRESLHVAGADEAVSLGDGAAAATYLDAERLLDVAIERGADAVHPGYGFLSEDADFARACAARGVRFVGPTPEHLALFGRKHRARELAASAGVPLLEGSGLVGDLDAARAAARTVGYPVMLKSTAGGGGIGMRVCTDEAALVDAFDAVRRLAGGNFGDAGVFVERAIPRARHIEVQAFGDGAGGVLAIGERDCSSQRRRQKVVEECPAPGLDTDLRARLHATAERLLESVNYLNAGTVEFIVDADSGDFRFLEVNTRLQVEHGVTEAVYGIDLVEWMLRQAAGDASPLGERRAALVPRGHAIQARLYAEDPFADFRPASGRLVDVGFPDADGVRVDTWVETGVEVSPWFDPLLAKLIVHAPDRRGALAGLGRALDATRLAGIETNVGYVRALLDEPAMRAGTITTTHLDGFRPVPPRIDVLRGGTQTTVQDVPGRIGHWRVGVPPSGPFDALSHRLANRLLGNDPTAAGLEIAVAGPALRFSVDARIVLGGAPMEATLDGTPVTPWRVTGVSAGTTLDLGRVGARGVRACLCVAGGLLTPPYLGSRSTFTLGRFGGHAGRALAAGDVLPIAALDTDAPDLASTGATGATLPDALVPGIGNAWTLRTVQGPHAAPDFLTTADIEAFHAADWEVHYQSSRTGVRLIGPVPEWARTDGGEAGLHPSNLHDNAYAFGTVDFTGDMPVILGPDGPSLGGFVCPATVIEADLWKLGQLRAGDTLRFEPVSVEAGVSAARRRAREIETLTPSVEPSPPAARSAVARRAPRDGNPAVLAELAAADVGDRVVYRAAGDRFVLVEYGDAVLDFRLRLRAHALMRRLEDEPVDGIEELTPGIRSLQVRYDGHRLPLARLLERLQDAERGLADGIDALEVDSRTVHLPLSWDDAACREAIDRYARTVRRDAPWCPSNLEFIRRINGLDSIEDVRRIVFDAEYLVLGLGDVYLGAPVATPIDPRHRLVTTKYNPARTWTAENSVGIGGSYLCVYGMEGPGGYQFVGRTLQVWNRDRVTDAFERPWLLRFFDRLRFHPVGHEELEQIRRDVPTGRYAPRIEPGTFSLAEHVAWKAERADSIAAFETRRTDAFAAELARWHADGQFAPPAEPVEPERTERDWPATATLVESPVAGSLWTCDVAPGDHVSAGQSLFVVESMKTEIGVDAPNDATVLAVTREPGQRVAAGEPLVVLDAPAAPEPP